MREARNRLKHDVESNHIDSPCIWVRGEACLPAGKLPSFIDTMTLEEALHTLPQGARLACIKCVSAWRMGHLDAKCLRDYLRSVAWQCPALQRCAELAPASLGGWLPEETAETLSEATDECDVMSEEDMQSMMCASG
jgi:hypothetical protein